MLVMPQVAVIYAHLASVAGIRVRDRVWVVELQGSTDADRSARSA